MGLLSALLSWDICLSPARMQSRPVPSVTQAKSEARPGYIFLSNHDEIVARAKSEGRLKVFSGLDGQRTLKKGLGEQFRKKDPFITSFQAEERGSGGASALSHGDQSGARQEWDATTVSTDLYSEYPPYIKNLHSGNGEAGSCIPSKSSIR